MGGCSQFTATTAGGELDIESDGDVTGTGFGVTVSILGVTCTYGFGEGILLGRIEVGAPAEHHISAAVKRVAGGFICPAFAVWESDYVITAPKPLFIGA